MTLREPTDLARRVSDHNESLRRVNQAARTELRVFRSSLACLSSAHRRTHGVCSVNARTRAHFSNLHQTTISPTRSRRCCARLASSTAVKLEPSLFRGVHVLWIPLNESSRTHVWFGCSRIGPLREIRPSGRISHNFMVSAPSFRSLTGTPHDSCQSPRRSFSTLDSARCSSCTRFPSASRPFSPPYELDFHSLRIVEVSLQFR